MNFEVLGMCPSLCGAHLNHLTRWLVPSVFFRDPDDDESIVIGTGVYLLGIFSELKQFARTLALRSFMCLQI